MYKKFLVLGITLLVLSFATCTVFAQNDTTSTTAIVTSTAITKVADVAARIVCVGTAVATREAVLATAMATHTQAIQAAYATRANELAGAYSNTTVKTLQTGVKVAWADFNKSVKAATKTWKDSRNAAWSAYRTAAKSCKATSDISDSGNSGFELSGQ